MAFVDALRCVAFMSVFAQHVFIDEIVRLAGSADPLVAGAFAAVDRFVRIDGAPGVFGVVLFFAISGYCITLAARRETPAQFVVRRVFRIYPLLIVALLVEVMLERIAGRATPGARALLGSATLLGDFMLVEPRLAGVEWTLRLEILFYGAMAIGLALAARLPLPGKSPPLLAPILAVSAVIALSPAFPSAMWTRGYINMFAPFLVLGASFAAFEQRRLSAVSLTVVGIVCIAVALWTQQAFRPDYARFAGYYTAAFGLFGGSWLLRDRFRGSRLVFRVSLLTYATYLFHGFLVGAIDRGLTWLVPYGSSVMVAGFSPNKLAAIAMFFAAMAALVASVEQPIIRWSKRLA